MIRRKGFVPRIPLQRESEVLRPLRRPQKVPNLGGIGMVPEPMDRTAFPPPEIFLLRSGLVPGVKMRQEGRLQTGPSHLQSLDEHETVLMAENHNARTTQF